MRKPIKVLIIDDSALVRDLLTKVLQEAPGIEVVGSAVDPLAAISKIKELRPDVLTLDLEMPRMDGLTFLEKLMAVHPMPVVVISSLALSGAEATIRALDLGAVDFVTKPSVGISTGLAQMKEEIIAKVENASRVDSKQLYNQFRKAKTDSPQAVEKDNQKRLVHSTDRIIAIGASTGGTVAVRQILTELPATLHGIVIVLHMPAGFTKSYANGLNGMCRLRVKEAEDKEVLANGYAYVAPGGVHLVVRKGARGYTLHLDHSPPMNRHRPSVDKTFFSVAEAASGSCMGVILTGMGDDGARGLKSLHDLGAYTIAQDEKTSIVFGMPKQAIQLGGVSKVLPLGNIAKEIIGYSRGPV